MMSCPMMLGLAHRTSPAKRLSGKAHYIRSAEKAVVRLARTTS
jgi:hypothetical protein